MSPSPLDPDLLLCSRLDVLSGSFFDEAHASLNSPDPVVRQTAGKLFDVAWSFRNASLTLRRLKARPAGWWG